MVEAKARRRGNDDLDDVFVATSRRTARDRAWGVIFGIGAFLVSRIFFFFLSRPILVFLPRAFEIG